MGYNTLDCDHCGAENTNTPIIEKPSRYGYKGEIYHLEQVNSEGRERDNVCIRCLNEQVEIETNKQKAKHTR